MYIQFTDFSNTTIDKGVNKDPDHSDPVGTYGYPIDYVLKFPADIWYGQRAKYLRVLKRETKYQNHLDLQSITTLSQALAEINKIYRANEAYDQYDYANRFKIY